MAWVKASRPVAAVMPWGIVRVIRGSTRATRGRMLGLAMSIFTSLAVSVMMVKGVTSLPVPAVVGMAMSGAAGLGILLAPMKSLIFPVLVASAPIALAVSIEL